MSLTRQSLAHVLTTKHNLCKPIKKIYTDNTKINKKSQNKLVCVRKTYKNCTKNSTPQDSSRKCS